MTTRVSLTAASNPVAPPEDPLCVADKSQVIVIDIQQRLGAAMPAKVLNRVIQNTRLILQTAELLALPVIATEQYPKGLGPIEARVAERLPPGAFRVEKTSFSCHGSPAFREQLAANERPQVVLAGMEAHVCVLQTAVALQIDGWQVFVVEDAVCSRRLENYQNALERLRQLGVQITSTESVVFEWLRDGSHARFKEISALLR